MGVAQTVVRTPRRRITKMLSLTRLLAIGLLRICLLCIWIGAATTAHAGTQLFEASWSIKAFGNECAQSIMNQGPYCPNNATTPEFEFYEAYRQPQGLLCNRYQPRCPFESTPTD